MSAPATFGVRPLRLPRALPIAAAGLLLVDLVAIVVLSATSPAFTTSFHAYIVLRDVAVTLLVALAQMVVLAIGQMNLSVGFIGGLVAVVVGALMVRAHAPVLVAVLAGLALGAAAGAANGVLVRLTKINSFILTLATGYVFYGVNLGLTKGVPYYHLPGSFESFGQQRAGFFPIFGVVTIGATFALAFLVRRTVLGRQILAVGGNVRAAELSGVPVARVVVVVHALSGLLAATAAILVTAQLGTAQPTVGTTWVLPSFAGPIIGGAALSGGTAPLLGTILAVLLIALINDGLVLLNANPYWVQFLIGALILGAVVLGRVRLGALLRRRPAPVRTTEAIP
jgi:ribose transport system permease protein